MLSGKNDLIRAISFEKTDRYENKVLFVGN